MRRIMRLALCAALPLGLAIAANPPSAVAAVQDGNWTVLVITEKGTCDRGYRYSVHVSNGRVIYAGDTKIRLDGTIAPDGQVHVSITGGSRNASGTGRLSAKNGIGTWRGAGSNGTTCAGTWEAERR